MWERSLLVSLVAGLSSAVFGFSSKPCSVCEEFEVDESQSEKPNQYLLKEDIRGIVLIWKLRSVWDQIEKLSFPHFWLLSFFSLQGFILAAISPSA